MRENGGPMQSVDAPFALRHPAGATQLGLFAGGPVASPPDVPAAAEAKTTYDPDTERGWAVAEYPLAGGGG